MHCAALHSSGATLEQLGRGWQAMQDGGTAMYTSGLVRLQSVRYSRGCRQHRPGQLALQQVKQGRMYVHAPGW